MIFTGFQIFNDVTLIIHNWLLSRLFEDLFIIKILLKNMNYNFLLSFAKIRDYNFNRNQILFLISFEEYFEIETISALDHNSTMLFLINEVSKTFEDL